MDARIQTNAANDLLGFVAMPEVAAVLRAERDAIIAEWEQKVEKLLPLADALTRQQVRNTLPEFLNDLATALESATPSNTEKLADRAKEHGETRFHQSYDVRQLIIEYRLLRRIVNERVTEAMGVRLTMEQTLALDMGVDIALQQGVTTFVDHQRERIEVANRTERRFLSFVSHDLRNILSNATLVMQLHSERLKGHAEFAEDLQELKSVQQSIVETMQGMDRLLEVEKLQRQTFHPFRETFDLSTTASAIVEQFSREATAHGLQLLSDVPTGFEVRSDANLIRLVLQNLVGNAVKFSNEGIVRITARRERDGGWSIAVSDQGPGIAPDQQQRIFEAFTRGDTRDTHGKRGVGLGLAIASQSALRLGGGLSVQSELGKGSVFRLTLSGMAG